jgi:hypothetical protein
MVHVAAAAILLAAACGGTTPPPPYPAATCDDGRCNGRVSTLGFLGPAGNRMFFVDLEQPLEPGMVMALDCVGCPFKPGATYRARYYTEEKYGLYSIMVDGQEIFGVGTNPRADGLYMSSEKWKCDQTPAHWELVGDQVNCVPGEKGPEIDWVSGDGLYQPVAGCTASFPRSFMSGSGSIKINIQLSSSYDLKDPELAHEAFPPLFVAALNEVAKATGFVDNQFELSDGMPMLYFRVQFDQDATGDHYGNTVTVKGPPDKASLEGGKPYTAQELFTYKVAPLYRSQKLIFETARRAVELLYPGGWTCHPDGPRPTRPYDAWCQSDGVPPEVKAGPICNHD